jgi:nucleotide-binding universal stress UspA family protein
MAARQCYIVSIMKTIVAAVDFSDATAGVLGMAVKLAKSFDARLELFHVIELEPSYTAYGFTPDEFPVMREFHTEAKRRAVAKLDEYLAFVRHEVQSVTARLFEGSPLHMLVEHVKKGGVDYVVVGSHGHGVIASLLLGSVAEGLIRKALVPTMVVPSQRE